MKPNAMMAALAARALRKSTVRSSQFAVDSMAKIMQKNIYPGKFIVFEGLDGSGQTTQAKLLMEFFESQGRRALLTKEPTLDSEAGKKIHAALHQKVDIDPRSLQGLFAEDRREHLERIIIPALKAGKIVISDRYFFSSFTYGAASGVDLEWLIELNSGFLMPDLTIILRVRPDICIKRIEKRGEKKTLFEKTEKLRKVWEIYEALPSRFSAFASSYGGFSEALRGERENVYIVDGERQIEEVFGSIKALVHSKLNLK